MGSKASLSLVFSTLLNVKNESQVPFGLTLSFGLFTRLFRNGFILSLNRLVFPSTIELDVSKTMRMSFLHVSRLEKKSKILLEGIHRLTRRLPSPLLTPHPAVKLNDLILLRPDSTTAKSFAGNCVCEMRMFAHERFY